MNLKKIQVTYRSSKTQAFNLKIAKQMYLIQTYIVKIFPTENVIAINKSASASPKYAINISLTKSYMTGDQQCNLNLKSLNFQTVKRR